jgi:4-amino-4-deoxy-L-arabinose transferase-like glycosyltransferase
MKRHFSFILLICIFVIGLSVRFIGLGSNPVGIVDDEADKAYDAYSLLKTGKDQWGESWPRTSFRGFGDYRLPAYTYLALPSIALYDLTPFAIRLPSALVGSLTIILVYFFVLELFRKKSDVLLGLNTTTLALLSAFFLSISPWHIGMSRVAHEATISVCVVMLGLYFLLKARRALHNMWASVVVFAFSIYVYTPNIVLVPFLALFTFLLHRDDYKKMTKILVFGSVVFVILITPLILSLQRGAVGARTSQVNLTNDTGVLTLVNEKRGACAEVMPGGVCRVVFNKYSAYTIKFITNYFYHFSPNLLSMYGTTSQFTILPTRGLLYLLEYPLLVVAIIAISLHFTRAGLFLLGMLFVGAVPDSVTSDGNYVRYFITFPVWSILTAIGVLAISRIVRKSSFVLGVIILGFIVGFLAFTVEYWSYFPKKYSVYSHYGYEELVGVIESQKTRYDRILVSNRVNDSKQYIFYLFYTKYDPTLFQRQTDIEKEVDPKGWVRVKRIGSVEFIPSLPNIDLASKSNENVLLVGAPSEFPKTYVPVQFRINDKKGDVLFQGVAMEDMRACLLVPCLPPAEAE